MAGYIRIVRMSIQNSLQFRGNYIFNIFNTIGLVPLIFIWKIIIQDGEIGGYDCNLMLTYTMMSSIMKLFLSTSVGGDVCTEIRLGTLTGYIIEPINHLMRHFSMFLGNLIGEAIPKSILQIITVIVLAKVLRFQIIFRLEFSILLLGLLVEGILITFLINLVFGLIGFWITESSIFFMLITAITNVMAGDGIPLDVLPWGLDKILIHTPFSYLAYYPIKAGMGQINSPLQAMGEGFVWICLLLFLVIVAWNRGLRKYTAPGG